MDREQREQLRSIERERRIHREARKFKVRSLSRYMFTIVLSVVGLLIAIIDPTTGEDYFRILDLGMGAFIIIFTGRIIQVNYKIARHTEGEMALMPLHIRTIALSYIIALISLHSWTISRMGTESVFWYGTPLITASDLIGIFSLGVIWRFQEVRRKAAGI